METTKNKITQAEMQKEISDCWKELYEQKKRDYERLEAENRELRDKCYVQSRTIENLCKLDWQIPMGF